MRGGARGGVGHTCSWLSWLLKDLAQKKANAKLGSKLCLQRAAATDCVLLHSVLAVGCGGVGRHLLRPPSGVNKSHGALKERSEKLAKSPAAAFRTTRVPRLHFD